MNVQHEQVACELERGEGREREQTYPTYAESLLNGITDTIKVSIKGHTLHIVFPEFLAVIHQSRNGQEGA